MAATALTVNVAATTGLDLDGVLVTPTQTTGHTTPCGAGIFLVVKNTSGGTTVTLYTPGTVDALAIADRTISVTAAHTELIPLPSALYTDPATGLATFDISGTPGNNALACVRIGGLGN